MRTALSTFLLLSVLVLSAPPAASAQSLEPRFGLGFNSMLSTPDGFGIGLRGRASAPLNADLSIAVDLGLTGFVLGGREDATYVFDPQVSAILTFPSSGRRAPYFLGGFGAYVPLSDEIDPVNGPTVHGGIGWVRQLSETTFFYELNPALIIGENGVHFALPARLGIIF